MSGAVKSGLIFAIVGVVATIAFSFIPLVGPLLCGPLAAAIVGTAAGYYGVRWSAGNAGVGRGVLAGAIAGVGALIGGALFWMLSFLIIRSNPELYQQGFQGIFGRGTGQELSQEELEQMLGVVGPIIALCFGLLNLLVSLALGALGGWMATRNRAQPAPPQPQPPMQPPPMAPPD